MAIFFGGFRGHTPFPFGAVFKPYFEIYCNESACRSALLGHARSLHEGSTYFLLLIGFWQMWKKFSGPIHDEKKNTFLVFRFLPAFRFVLFTSLQQKTP